MHDLSSDFMEFNASEDFVDAIVEEGAVPVLVKHLQAPPYSDGDEAQKSFEHEVEKGSAFALGYLAIKVLIHTLHSCCYFLESNCLVLVCVISCFGI